jgi:hypothetical protein
MLTCGVPYKLSAEKYTQMKSAKGNGVKENKGRAQTHLKEQFRGISVWPGFLNGDGMNISSLMFENALELIITWEWERPHVPRRYLQYRFFSR